MALTRSHRYDAFAPFGLASRSDIVVRSVLYGALLQFPEVARPLFTPDLAALSELGSRLKHAFLRKVESDPGVASDVVDETNEAENVLGSTRESVAFCRLVLRPVLERIRLGHPALAIARDLLAERARSPVFFRQALEVIFAEAVPLRFERGHASLTADEPIRVGLLIRLFPEERKVTMTASILNVSRKPDLSGLVLELVTETGQVVRAVTERSGRAEWAIPEGIDLASPRLTLRWNRAESAMRLE